MVAGLHKLLPQADGFLPRMLELFGTLVSLLNFLADRLVQTDTRSSSKLLRVRAPESEPATSTPLSLPEPKRKHTHTGKNMNQNPLRHILIVAEAPLTRPAASFNRGLF